jgi:hypothetical protein
MIKLKLAEILPHATIESYHFIDHINIIASFAQYNSNIGDFSCTRYFLAQVKKMPPSTAVVEKPLFDHLMGDPVFSFYADLKTISIYDYKGSYYVIKSVLGHYEQCAGCYSKEFSFYDIVNFVIGKAH